jgi:hypothetical protein
MNTPDKGAFGEGVRFDAFIIMGGDGGGGSAHVSPTSDIMINVSLKEGLHVPDRLAEAYLTSRNELHATGLAGFDEAALHDLNTAKASGAARLRYLFTFMTDPAPAFMAELGNAWFWKARKIVEQGVNWDSYDMQQVLEVMRPDAGIGMVNSPVLTGLRRLHRFTYAPELGRDDPYVPQAADRELLEPLFGTARLDEGVPTSEVSSRLREEGTIAVTVDRLDAQVENFGRVTQLEAVTYFLHHLHDMWTVGGAAREASLALFARYRPELFRDNYAGKQAMLATAANVIDGIIAAGRVEDTRPQEFLNLFAERMRAFVSDCQEVNEDFARIRESLITNETDVAAATGAVVLTKTTKKPDADPPDDDPPEADPAAVNDLQFRAAGLTTRAESSNQRWKMKKAAITKAGLDGAIRMLTHPNGLSNVSGQFLQPKMDRERAVELVAIIHQFGSMTPDRLSNALMHEYELIADVNMLGAEIRTSAWGADIALPSVFRPSRQLVTFRENWHWYEQVILTVWPPAAARKVIDNIKALLPPAE